MTHQATVNIPATHPDNSNLKFAAIYPATISDQAIASLEHALIEFGYKSTVVWQMLTEIGDVKLVYVEP